MIIEPWSFTEMKGGDLTINREILEMFSQVYRFLPTKFFQNAYSAIFETFDFDTERGSPKPMREAAFDKAFWAAHYTTVIEELAQNLVQKRITAKTLASLKERLVECQDMIGRYTLSPKWYEEGLQDLIRILQESTPDESLSCIAMLNSIRLNLQQTLREQRYFTKECFIGDANHWLAQWGEEKISAFHFKQAMAYYAGVMALADYCDGLLKLQSHFQADERLHPLRKTIDQLLSQVDLFAAKKSRQALHAEVVEDMLLQSETVVPEATNRTIRTSNAAQKSSFLDRFWAAGSGVISYIITHPLQSVTAGLAVQSTAVMAFTKSDSLFPTPSCQSLFPVTLSPSITASDQASIIGFNELALPTETSLKTKLQNKSIPTNGLIAYYAFNGNANDETGRGHHGTVIGATLTTDRFGNANSAYHFNGAGSYIRIPATTDLKSAYLSISVWAKRTSLSTSWQQIISATEQANRYIVGWYDNDIIGSTHSPASIIKTPISYVDANWHHIVLSYEEGQRLLYVDGELKANQTITGPITGYNSGWVGVGMEDENQDGTPDMFGFAGDIDDIGIYNRALTINEVTNLYNDGLPLVPMKPELGEEFRVNSYVFNDQFVAAGAQLMNGKFVIIWESLGQDGDTYGLYGQMYHSDGSRYNAEFRVNTNTVGIQSNPAITGLLDGGFVVVWQSTQTGIWNVYGKIYNIDGIPYGEELQLTSTSYTSADVSVAALSNGGFVIVWNADLSSRDVYAQTYRSNGVKYGPQVMVNSYVNGWQAFPTVSSFSNGGFVVTWQSNQDGAYDIYTQIYDDATVKHYANELLVNFNILDQQQTANIATLSDGKFLIVWDSNLEDGDQHGIYGQIFYENGAIYGNERNFRVNTRTIGSQEITSGNRNSCIAVLTDRKFVIVWTDNGQDGSGFGVYGKIYHPDGSVYKDEFQINTHTSGDQIFARSISLTDNRFMVTWSSFGQDTSGYGIYAKIFSIKPILKTNVVTISEGQSITLTNANLNAIDGFGAANTTLTFTVLSKQHADFILDGVSVMNFSQQNIADGRVKFVHDGGEIAPSYMISVTDRLGASSIAAEANISFANVMVSPTPAGTGSPPVISTFSATTSPNSASVVSRSPSPVLFSTTAQSSLNTERADNANNNSWSQCNNISCQLLVGIISTVVGSSITAAFVRYCYKNKQNDEHSSRNRDRVVL